MRKMTELIDRLDDAAPIASADALDTVACGFDDDDVAHQWAPVVARRLRRGGAGFE
jgi:hypothetical protein